MRRLAAVAFAVTFIVASGAPARGQSVATDAEGRTITGVVLRSDISGDRDTESAREMLLALVPGEPFSAEAARQTLLNLQGSGLFSEVEIYTRLVGPSEGEAGRAEGVEVTIAAWANIMVEELADRRRGDTPQGSRR